MKKILKVIGKILLWMLGIIVGLLIISAVAHNTVSQILKTSI